MKMRILCLAAICSCALVLGGSAAAEEMAGQAVPALQEPAPAATPVAMSTDQEVSALDLLGLESFETKLAGRSALGFSDCDSPPGSCSSNAQCWQFCMNLVCEIGFCSPISNCCVCPESSGC